jgi:hypothetical protein
VLAAALIAAITIMAVGFSVLQSEIDALKPQEHSQAVTTSPTSPPSTLSPIATHPPYRHNYTVFEWTLKNEYINNVTWLSSIGPYHDIKTWTENYVYIISHNGGSAFPSQMRDSLAAASFVVPAFVNVEFNEQTGFTKATYRYLEQDFQPYLYTVETSLFYSVKDSALVGWREYFV